jgi:hypothetical protein
MSATTDNTPTDNTTTDTPTDTPVDTPITATSSGTDICGFIKKLRACDDFDDVRGMCDGYHLNPRREFVDGAAGASGADAGANANAIEPKPHRIIISGDKFNSDFTDPINYQCNGVVFDGDYQKVLSYPAPICRPVYNKAELLAGIQQSRYEIYRMRDGTIITLYWYEPESRWCMSSANGYDIGTFKWIGSTTYWEAFNKIASGIEGFSLDNLDKSKCYTLGFRFHEFHLFTRDPECIWFVQCCDLDALNADEPKLVVITASGWGGDSGNGGGNGGGNGIPTEVAMLQRQQAVAVAPTADGANQFFANMRAQSTASLNNDANHYGYLFRDPSCMGANANVVIESNLMQSLRRMLYDFSAAKRDKRIRIDNNNRLSYTLIKCYLNYNLRSQFIKLMPHFEARFNHFNKVVNLVIAKVITRLRSRGRGGDSRSPLDNLAKTLTTQIMSAEPVNVNDPNTRGIIHDRIVNPKYMSLWYRVLDTQPDVCGTE